MKDKRFFTRSFYQITAGMFFLINPLFNVVDVLPDVIGYLLIYLGITELAILDGRMESARKRLQYLIAVSALKLSLTYAVISSSMNSDRLLAVFCFAIVELILSVMFFSDFFAGFSYLAERNKGEKTDLAIPNARFLSSIFIITKIVFSVIPELYSLAEIRLLSEITNYEFYESLLRSKPFTQAFCLLVVMIMGVVWYISIFKLLRTAKNEDSFTQNLQDLYYSEYLAHPEKQNIKTLRIGLYTVLAGLFFFLDIAIDGIRILPEAGAVILITAAAVILKKLGPFKNTLRIAPFAIAFQILTEVLRYVFIDTNAILMSEIKLSAVAVSALAVVVKAGITLLFMSAFLKELRNSFYLLTGKEAPTFTLCKILFLTSILIKSLQIILPPVLPATSAAYLIVTGGWLFFCGRNIMHMIDVYSGQIRYL